MQDGANNLGTVAFNFTLGTSTTSTATFTNNTLINIPLGAPTATVGSAAPYPSSINVSGLRGTISKLTVKLNKFNHTEPDDVDILLVAPDGRKTILMSDAGGENDAVNLDLTFDDTAAALPDANALATATYHPTNFGGTTDNFSSPAPSGTPPEPQQLAAFNGAQPNGTWSLYVMDDGNLDVGSVFNGWSLTITTVVPSCCSSTACPTITINPPSINNATAGTAYSQSFTQINGATPSNFSLAGTIPPGLSLTGAMLSGTPTQTGSFGFTISAIDANSCTGDRSYTLNVGCAALNIVPASLPAGTVGAAYSHSLAASGGVGTVMFSLSGTSPAGLTLTSDGLLSGVPTQQGNFNFTVNAADANGCIGTRNYVLNITCPTITINPAVLAQGRVGVAYNQSLTQAGSLASASFTVSGTLPNGLTLAANGTLAGTPTLAGSFNFTINAFAAGGCSGSRAYTLVINLASARADFDGDGRSDISLWRGIEGGWHISRSANGALQTATWGVQTAPFNDVAVPGDYDGDGKADVAVWRAPEGLWYIVNSATGNVRVQQWGGVGDTPVPADYDGDGKTDVAVWRGQEGIWFILRSSDGAAQTTSWGLQSAPFNDVPVPADYDGDRKADVAVWRQANSHWYILQSSNNAIIDQQWGGAGDTPVPGDYDGDGKTDIAVWRGATMFWYIIGSSSSQVQIVAWGTSAAPYLDIPVPGDYDGDGKTDIAVWRSSSGDWFIRRSSDAAIAVRNFGRSGDTPLPSAPRYP